MRLIIAIVRPEKLPDVKEALWKKKVHMMTLVDVRGCGQQKGYMEEYFEDKYLNRHPLHRFGNPEELSNLAAFLMSDLSPYITGECITIDGGESLNGGQFNFVAQLMPRTQLKEFFSHLRSKKS